MVKPASAFVLDRKSGWLASDGSRRRRSCRSCGAAYHAANRERDTRRYAAWYAANRERQTTTIAAWRARNPDRAAAQYGLSAARRRAGVKSGSPNDILAPGATSASTITDTMEVYAEARRLTEEYGVKFEVDHVTPLIAGGLHEPGNLDITTKWHNGQKSGKERDDVLERLLSGQVKAPTLEARWLLYDVLEARLIGEEVPQEHVEEAEAILAGMIKTFCEGPVDPVRLGELLGWSPGTGGFADAPEDPEGAA